MEFTIQADWWLLPTTITAITLVWLMIKLSSLPSFGGGLSDIADGIYGMFCAGGFAVVNLFVWLVYFIVN